MWVLNWCVIVRPQNFLIKMLFFAVFSGKIPTKLMYAIDPGFTFIFVCSEFSSGSKCVNLTWSISQDLFSCIIPLDNHFNRLAFVGSMTVQAIFNHLFKCCLTLLIAAGNIQTDAVSHIDPGFSIGIKIFGDPFLYFMCREDFYCEKIHSQ